MTLETGTPLPSDPRWPRAAAWWQQGAPPGASVDIALLGVPAWRTSLSPTGAHATPEAVRAALARYSTYDATADRDLRDALVVQDLGDVYDPDGPEGEARVAEVVAAAADASVLLAVGGDNSITASVGMARWGDGIVDAGLISLDGHHDLRDGRSNGSPIRRLVAAGLAGTRVVQVGIADFANSREYAARARDLGITVVHRDVLHHRPLDDVMAEAFDVAGAGGGAVHVDLDVDVCDRSVAPGCPASVPGGLAAHELRRVARLSGRQAAVTCVDVTEVDATADTRDQRTVRLAALLVLEVAAGVADRG